MNQLQPLDPELEAQVLRVLNNLAQENQSMIIVTHNMDFCSTRSRSDVVSEDGEIDFDGTPDEFFNKPTARIHRF